jgi:hypothetical protein
VKNSSAYVECQGESWTCAARRRSATRRGWKSRALPVQCARQVPPALAPGGGPLLAAGWNQAAAGHHRVAVHLAHDRRAAHSRLLGGHHRAKRGERARGAQPSGRALAQPLTSQHQVPAAAGAAVCGTCSAPPPCSPGTWNSRPGLQTGPASLTAEADGGLGCGDAAQPSARCCRARTIIGHRQDQVQASLSDYAGERQTTCVCVPQPAAPSGETCARSSPLCFCCQG